MERTGSAFQDIDVRTTVGNLKGWYGYSTEIFGFAAGNYKEQNITVDPINGLRIRNVDTLQLQASGSTLTIGDNFIFNSTTGLLKVSGSNIELESPTFFLGNNSQFISGSNGNLRIESTNFTLAQNGDVSMTGTVTAEAGQIGGFAITDSAITGSGFFLSGSATGNQFFISASNFNVKANGDITASNADISGNINAQTGTIGGFSISEDALSSGNNFFISGSATNNEFFISSSKFNVKANGDVTASNANITGDIVATNITAINQGNIAGFTLTANQLSDSGNNLVLKSSGQITGSNVLFTGGKISGSAIEFDVTEFVAKGNNVEISGSSFHLLNGNITASNVDLSGEINAESGTIGGFNIGSNLSNSAGSTLILKGATGQITASAAQITGNITATSGQIAGFTISGDRIVGTEYTIDASADANNEYFISSSNVKIEGNGDAVFGEYSFALLNDAFGQNGLSRTSNLTNIRVIQGIDANGHGGLFGVAANGSMYFAPVSSSTLVGGGWDSFARELKYNLPNDRWEFDTNVLVKDNLTSTGTVSGSQLESSGNTTVKGNLTVLGNTTISGTVSGHIAVSPVASDSNNSNGVVIQDLSFDSFGHVESLGTVDLDGRYFTETEADGRYLKLTGGTITSGGSIGLTINHNDFAEALVIHRNDANNAPSITFKNNTGQAGILYVTQADGALRWRPLSTSQANKVFHEGFHPNADTLTTARTITLGGDLTGNVSFDGSTNVTLTAAVVDDSHNHIISNVDGLQTALDGKLNTSGGTITGNLIIGDKLLSSQNNTDVDTGTETVASVAIATYDAAFFDFVVKNGTNLRAGTVYAIHDGTNVEFTETSTQDLGDTSDVTLSVDISGGNLRLLATTTSNDWSVKALVRGL
jgi:hypothetical protein